MMMMFSVNKESTVQQEIKQIKIEEDKELLLALRVSVAIITVRQATTIVATVGEELIRNSVFKIVKINNFNRQ